MLACLRGSVRACLRASVSACARARVCVCARARVHAFVSVYDAVVEPASVTSVSALSPD